MNYSKIIEEISQSSGVSRSVCKKIVDDFLAQCEKNVNEMIPTRTKEYRIIPRVRDEKVVQNKEGVSKTMPIRRYGLFEKINEKD